MDPIKPTPGRAKTPVPRCPRRTQAVARKRVMIPEIEDPEICQRARTLSQHADELIQLYCERPRNQHQTTQTSPCQSAHPGKKRHRPAKS